jgi:hypothetical protein
VALTWNTASEHNNDRFVVERAGEQSDVFQAIGQVKGVGNTSHAQQYQFTDKDPLAVGYYRLRQVDADGKEEFSPVVVVRSAAKATPLMAYPSPATDFITVAGATGSSIGLFNQFGHRLQEVEVTPVQRQQIDVRNLPAGVYFLRNAATGQSTRFVKDAGGR